MGWELSIPGVFATLLFVEMYPDNEWCAYRASTSKIFKIQFFVMNIILHFELYTNAVDSMSALPTCCEPMDEAAQVGVSE